MTRNELLRRYPNASPAFLRANADPTAGTLPRPVHEPGVQENPLVEDKGKEASQTRAPIRVTITCRRVRLLDEDNPCEKFLVDALRYEKLIPGDSPELVSIEVRQQKVAHKAEEETVILIAPQNRRCPHCGS